MSLFNSDCVGFFKVFCGPAPKGLAVARLMSKSGRVSEGDWTDILVVTQAGKPDPTFDPTVPSINYDLRLHTDRADLQVDLQVFRTVLQTIRIAPEE